MVNAVDFNLLKPARVLLVCRVRLYSEAIAGILSREPDIDVVGSVNMDADIVATLHAVSPDVVLLDSSSPGALALAMHVTRARPPVRILGFAVDDVPADVVACAQAGLWGYVPSSASIEDLTRATRRVANGETVCSAGITDELFRYLGRAVVDVALAPAQSELTLRQQQIVQLIGEGLSNKEIARRLSLGTSTVKNHVHQILDRLHVTRRAEAARRFSRIF